ncbi:MAG: hypothetical protein IJV75_04350 [Alphaproteobacteria bacterium]|nr:hypothetical protein [Alphaproteobacteria bacterium]
MSNSFEQIKEELYQMYFELDLADSELNKIAFDLIQFFKLGLADYLKEI